MTTDIAARGDSGAAERDPMLGAPNIGLFPQLIDVIRSLTDGQELLSKRLRDVRNAYADPLATHNEFANQVGSDIAEPLSLAGRASTPLASGPERVASRSSTDSGADPAPLEGPLPDSAAQTIQLVSPVDSAATLGGSVAQSKSISTTTEQPQPVLPADTGRDDGQRRQPLPSSDANGTTTSPANRDYNFFDELDARLADLHDPAD